ncbi:MAG: hypothetical protein ACM3SY_15055 [Candidatus Omnitrophota bacterium]
MVNLEEIQKRLNEDKNYRDQFFADPVGFLKQEGIILPESENKNLLKLVKDIKDKKPPMLGAAPGEFYYVGVTVGIRF